MTLLLGDYTECDDIVARLADEYSEKPEAIAAFEILAAGYWPGSYCGMGWVLLRDRTTGALYEVDASHCSCYGLEGQWTTGETTKAYLLSEHFPLRADVDFDSYDVGNQDRAAIRALAEALPS